MTEEESKETSSSINKTNIPSSFWRSWNGFSLGIGGPAHLHRSRVGTTSHHSAGTRPIMTLILSWSLTGRLLRRQPWARGTDKAAATISLQLPLDF